MNTARALLFIITHHLVNINSMLKKQLSICTSSLEINMDHVCVYVCYRERERETPVYRLLTFCTRKRPFNNSSSLLNKHPRIRGEDGIPEINTHACLPTEPENPSVNCHKLSDYSDQLHHVEAWILKPKMKQKINFLAFPRGKFPIFFFWSWNLISDAHHGAIKTHPTADSDILSLKRRCKAREIGSLREALL